MARTEDVHAIEATFVAQWSNFGLGPGGSLHEESGLLWLEAPVPQLPYNGVLRTHLEADVDERIEQMIARFRMRGVQFMWLVFPGSEPRDLADRLLARDLGLVENSTGMSLDLSAWAPSSEPDGAIVYREAADEQGMRDYEELIGAYWELPEESRDYVFGINRWAAGQELGVRWVAYKNDRPVGKVYLSWVGLEDTAAIFGVFVDGSARGHGVATRLTELAIARAAEEGRRRVVLHSSEVAVGLYRRMGFTDRCELPVYATTSLHSLQPS